MSWLGRLFAAPESKASRAWSTHIMGLGRAQWSPRNYGAFSREAYQTNVIAYSAINRIAQAVSSIEWLVEVSGTTTDGHPMLDLLRRPNPAQSGVAWWHTRVGYFLLSGNLYDEMVLDSRGRPGELWPLRPDRMSIIQGSRGLPAGYEYRMDNKNRVRFAADPITGEGPILHTKTFNPLDDWYGMSPVEASAYSVDQHNESSSWIQSLLQNAARPSGAMIVDKEQHLSDEEFLRIKREVEEKYSGAANAGRPMLLEGGLDWKAMGFSPMDMEILKTKEGGARDISLAFGVPPLLLNIPGDNTYANYREARLGFYEDTVLPFIRFQISNLNHWLGPYYGGARLRPNIDKIEAIADKRTKMWEMADSSDDLTLNESRAIKGYDPLPEPLGSMLMAEVRAQAKGGQESEPDESVEEVMREAAFGSR